MEKAVENVQREHSKTSTLVNGTHMVNYPIGLEARRHVRWSEPKGWTRRVRTAHREDTASADACNDNIRHVCSAHDTSSFAPPTPTVRVPLGAPQTANQNKFSNSGRQAEPLVVLKEAMPHTLPNEGPMGVALTGHFVTTMRDSTYARDPTERPDARPAHDEHLSAASVVLQQCVSAQNDIPLDETRQHSHSAPPAVQEMNYPQYDAKVHVSGTDAHRLRRGRACAATGCNAPIHPSQCLSASTPKCPTNDTVHTEYKSAPDRRSHSNRDASKRDVEDGTNIRRHDCWPVR